MKSNISTGFTLLDSGFSKHDVQCVWPETTCLIHRKMLGKGSSDANKLNLSHVQGVVTVKKTFFPTVSCVTHGVN